MGCHALLQGIFSAQGLIQKIHHLSKETTLEHISVIMTNLDKMKALVLCVKAQQPNTDSLKVVVEVKKKKKLSIENFFVLVTSNRKPNLNVA